MATVNRTNAAPSVTEAKVNPADMLGHVLMTAKATRTAALQMVCASVGYLFLVNHFRDTNAEGYQTIKDATDYLTKQIDKQANVKGGMLDIYVRNAKALYSKIVGSTRMFSPVIQQIGEATSAQAIGDLLGAWLEANHNVRSMSELSEALGYKTGRRTTTGGSAATPDSKIESLGNTMKAVEAFVTEKKLTEPTVAKAVVSHASKPIWFAVEAIKRLTDPKDLTAIEKAVKEQRAELGRISAKAKELAKDIKAQHKGTVARNKASGLMTEAGAAASE